MSARFVVFLQQGQMKSQQHKFLTCNLERILYVVFKKKERYATFSV